MLDELRGQLTNGNGRLTAATRRGSIQDSGDLRATVRAKAADLLARGATTDAHRQAVEAVRNADMLRPDDVLALAELEESLTPRELGSVESAKATGGGWGPSRDPAPTIPPALGATLTEVVAAAGAARGAAQLALDKIVRTRTAEAQATTEQEGRIRAAAREAAEAEYAAARAALDQAGTRVTQVQRELAERRRAAVLEAHKTT